jgi:hypothetical protein
VVIWILVGSTSAFWKTFSACQMPSTDWLVTPSVKETGMPPCG